MSESRREKFVDGGTGVPRPQTKTPPFPAGLKFESL
jgi:hypothetical protein